MKSFEAKEFLENFEVSTGGDSIMDLLNDLRNAIDNKGKEQIIKDMVRIWQLVLDNVRAELQKGGMNLDDMEDVPKRIINKKINKKMKKLLSFSTIRASLIVGGILLTVLTGDGSWENAGPLVYIGMGTFVVGLALPWLVGLYEKIKK
jgi:hypothetical protein